MKANLMNGTIEMSKNEAKAAGRINSDKFNELMGYREAYPTFTISIIETPKKKSQYKGLDYNYMETYIENCKKENKNEIMDNFNILRAKDNADRPNVEKVKAASYKEIKEWFLKTFPEIAQHKENQNKKIADILKPAERI